MAYLTSTQAAAQFETEFARLTRRLDDYVVDQLLTVPRHKRLAAAYSEFARSLNGERIARTARASRGAL